jgi:ATP-dependent helicase/nuclease subunit B
MALSADLRIAPSDHLITRTAEHILQCHADRLPNLSQIVVLLPSQGASIDLRSALLQQLTTQKSTSALIPPWCGTLSAWLNQQYSASGHALSEHSRRLLFIEALEQHSELFREENKWQVSIALLKLFDELNLQQIQLTKDIEDWESFIQLSYGLLTPHLHLHREAALVHTLWNAWHQQLEANQQSDASLAYVQRLNTAMQDSDDNHYYYAATCAHYSNAERAYITHLQQQGHCTLIDFDDSIKDNNTVWRFIDSTFDFTTTPLLERTQKAKALPALPFTLFLAANAEIETRAVDLQIRKCLFAGYRNIGVVCEDRKLSRRLRALLERAGIPLQDIAGWSLATTSAAAVLERWLECIETDFDYRAFLDVIKSHFLSSDDREHHLNNVYRLEHDIILHENIGHGLARYKKQLKYRLDRLPHWPNSSYSEIQQLLDDIANISAALQKLYQSEAKQKLSVYLEALNHSLDALGITQSFNNDAAGISILQLLEELQQSITDCNPELHWQDFRNWLGMALEEQLFSPQSQSSIVQLMTLEQATLKQFDALIIAAADEQYLPGRAETSPFFNQAVRQSLGLPTWEQQRAERLQRFKRLLLSADTVLLTCKSHDHGEPIPLSPWIEALRVHYQLSFGRSIDDTALPILLEQIPDLKMGDDATLPTVPARPAPTTSEQLVPHTISASGHQRLINCPYQYFAADILALKPSDEISEELQKSDYGERVHKILQAFHQQVKNLPAPFAEPVTQNNRDAAIAHLSDISQRVFAQDQQDNLLHRSWQHRWQTHIPAYIDWQIKQQQHSRVIATEQHYDVDLNEDLNVYGRLDRIDQPDTNDHSVIIDYKTGGSAQQNDVDTGEDVQLITYAMLDQKVDQVMYLSLDESNGEVKTRAQLTGDELQQLRADSEQRLQEIFSLLNSAHPLTAWGDEASCQYCHFAGLCRRNIWNR